MRLDMFNGEVVSYTVSESPNLKLVMSMLYKAAQKNVWGNDTVIHSDQGWHYQHYVYTSYLKARNMVQSMS
ncbi:MAG: IS3 family transposase, partial [Bacteroidales bacterium]|nr:IS3 family transposase [Bacteroidales bacterium]